VTPLEVACPACNARPGRPCTAPTDAARRPVTWFHFARADAARHPTTEENR